MMKEKYAKKERKICFTAAADDDVRILFRCGEKQERESYVNAQFIKDNLKYFVCRMIFTIFKWIQLISINCRIFIFIQNLFTTHHHHPT